MRKYPGEKKENPGKHGNVTSLWAIHGLLPYVGLDFISRCCCWDSFVDPLFPHSFPPTANIMVMMDCSTSVQSSQQND